MIAENTHVVLVSCVHILPSFHLSSTGVSWLCFTAIAGLRIRATRRCPRRPRWCSWTAECTATRWPAPPRSQRHQTADRHDETERTKLDKPHLRRELPGNVNWSMTHRESKCTLCVSLCLSLSFVKNTKSTKYTEDMFDKHYMAKAMRPLWWTSHS